MIALVNKVEIYSFVYEELTDIWDPSVRRVYFEGHNQ